MLLARSTVKPGSGGASPYLRRACQEQASARRMGLCFNLHEHWQVGAKRPMTRLKAVRRNIGS
jgi:hypothetical protein